MMVANAKKEINCPQEIWHRECLDVYIYGCSDVRLHVPVRMYRSAFQSLAFPEPGTHTQTDIEPLSPLVAYVLLLVGDYHTRLVTVVAIIDRHLQTLLCTSMRLLLQACLH
jgi:hypothetical protein